MSTATTTIALSDEHKKKIGEVFVEPKANRFIMAVTLFLIHNLGYVGLPFLRFFGGLRRFIPFVKGMDMAGLDLPRADIARAQRAMDTGAAFLAPNHPEMFTDWLVDWDVTSRIAKKCAFWGGFDIVNGPLAPLWLRHNLIANTPGGGGKDYSVKAAARGDGVLLHPEGDVAYTGRTLQPVFPGVADLAERTAQALDGEKPTYILPLLYRYRFVEDPTPGLHRRIDVLETRLGMVSTQTLPLGPRFFAFQRHLLSRLAERHDIELADTLTDETYFTTKHRFVERMLCRLELTHRLTGTGTVEERIRRIRKALRTLRRHREGGEARFREGMAKVDMLHMLHRFSRDAYGQDALTLEQIAETLTRTRGALLRKTLADGLRSFMPMGCARRVAHVRVLAPLEVTAQRGSAAERRLYVAETLARYQARMEDGLRALDDEFVDEDLSRAVPNQFADRAPLALAA